MTQLIETVADEFFERMNVSDSQVSSNSEMPRHCVAQWSVRPAPGRPVLAKEVRVLFQDVFRCHFPRHIKSFRRNVVAIPRAERVHAP